MNKRYFGAAVLGAAALAASAAAATPIASTTATTTYHRAEVGGVGIFYREAGLKDAPTVVLLHGFPSSSREFDTLIPLLATRYHLIAPDFPGFGQPGHGGTESRDQVRGPMVGRGPVREDDCAPLVVVSGDDAANWRPGHYATHSSCG